MAVNAWQAVGQGGSAESAIEAVQPPVSDSPVPVPTFGSTYFPGQLGSLSAWIMRAVQVTAFSIIEPQQFENQQSLVHDWTVEGKWQPLAQNVAVLTAQAAMVPATLMPNYGMQMDTAESVYRNIASGGVAYG